DQHIVAVLHAEGVARILSGALIRDEIPEHQVVLAIGINHILADGRGVGARIGGGIHAGIQVEFIVGVVPCAGVIVHVVDVGLGIGAVGQKWGAVGELMIDQNTIDLAGSGELESGVGAGDRLE